MTVLSANFGIITDGKINAIGHVKNTVDGINDTEKRFLKEQMEHIGNLRTNDTSNSEILPCD